MANEWGNNLPWPLIQERLEQKRKEAVSELEHASSLEQIWVAKGRLGLLRELANLPATLQVLNEEEEPT